MCSDFVSVNIISVRLLVQFTIETVISNAETMLKNAEAEYCRTSNMAICVCQAFASVNRLRGGEGRIEEGKRLGEGKGEGEPVVI